MKDTFFTVWENRNLLLT